MIEYKEALTKYFQLKQEYKEKYDKKKGKIISSDITLKEKRDAIRKIKMKCVSCQRPVGTIFEDKERTYTAVCGDRKTPCSLHIEIKKGSTTNIDYFIPVLREEIDNDKYKIVKTKLSLLFGFLKENELEEIYNELVEEYKSNKEMQELFESVYKQNVNEEDREKNINKIQYEFLENVNGIKSLIQKYKDTENTSFIRDAVELYIDEIDENLKLLRENKYNNMELQYNNDDDKFHLVQEKYTIQDLEMETEEGNVIVFQI